MQMNNIGTPCSFMQIIYILGNNLDGVFFSNSPALNVLHWVSLPLIGLFVDCKNQALKRDPFASPVAKPRSSHHALPKGHRHLEKF